MKTRETTQSKLGLTWRKKSATGPRDKYEKKDTQETSKEWTDKEQTKAILFYFSYASEVTMNHYLQPAVSRKHHKESSGITAHQPHYLTLKTPSRGQCKDWKACVQIWFLDIWTIWLFNPFLE